MILPIYIYGTAPLRKVCRNITGDYPALTQFVGDMWETLKESDGIGLAAPQVGKDVRVVVIDLNELRDKFPEYTGFKRVYINGHIVEYDDTDSDTSEEGCLSLPGLHENITRPRRIHIRYCDEAFVAHDEWVDGYLARVVQHEFDHLEGVLFVDHLSALRRQLIRNKLKAFTLGHVKCDYKVRTR